MARMFRRTAPQTTIGSLDVLLSPKKIARLERRYGAGVFRRKSLPVLLGVCVATAENGLRYGSSNPIENCT